MRWLHVHESSTRAAINADPAATVRPGGYRNRFGCFGITPGAGCICIEGSAGLPEFCSKGKASHLSAPVGRAIPDGPVRLQTEAKGTLRPRPAGFYSPRPAAHGHDVEPEEVPSRAFQVRVRSIRPGGHMDV